MECMADRFVEATNGDIVDLATGERVLLTIASAGGETEQRRWMIRCDLFQKLHHPAIAMLIDYGLLGAGQRFEAWRCSEPWRGSESAAANASRAARSFLEACDLDRDAHRLRALGRRTTVRGLAMFGAVAGKRVGCRKCIARGALFSRGVRADDR